MFNHGLSRLILVCACAALVACAQTGVEDSAPATVAGEATESAQPTASEAPPSASTSASPAEPAEHEVGGSVPFTITTPGEWELESGTPAEIVSFRASSDRWLVFNRIGPDTVEAWAEQLTSDARFEATEPAPAEIGGAPGVAFDVTLAEGEAEVDLFGNPLYGWVVSPARPNRVWIVAVDSVPVMIVTDAPERAFEGWIATVEEVLATLEWEE